MPECRDRPWWPWPGAPVSSTAQTLCPWAQELWALCCPFSPCLTYVVERLSLSCCYIYALVRTIVIWTLTHRLIFCLYFRPASSSQTRLMIWTSGWTCLPSLGITCPGTMREPWLMRPLHCWLWCKAQLTFSWGETGLLVPWQGRTKAFEKKRSKRGFFVSS